MYTWQDPTLKARMSTQGEHTATTLGFCLKLSKLKMAVLDAGCQRASLHTARAAEAHSNIVVCWLYPFCFIVFHSDPYTTLLHGCGKV